MISVGDDPARSAPLTVALKSGRLYVTRALYDRYFAGLASVILLRRDADLMIMPVRHAAAGGYVMKVRTAAGDRVVEAMDFFRDNGSDQPFERILPVAWDPKAAALAAQGIFAVAK